ncbi:MAG: Ig-like domain-containing protein, partial [Chloroflexi bacterium]|nr:Ig-like domain-containing protein [Chloroflexota bacterium]
MNQRIWIAQLIVMGLMLTAVTTACTRADTNTQQIAAPPTTIITETATAILPTPTTAAPIEAAATPTASVQTQDSTPPHATLDTIHNLEEYPADAPIIVHFNEPMNSANNRPLLFSPTISGSFEWNDENTTVQFTPNNPFLGNRVYQISVNASLRTQDNRLTNIDRWRIHIRSTPLVQRRTPHEPTVATHKPIFRLYFNRPMNAQSVADAFNMEPPLPYTLSWDEDTLLVSIQEPLTFGTAYHFSVANTAVDTTGYHLLNGYTWDTQLKPLVNGFSKPTISTHLAPVEVSFNYPIDPEKSSSFVSIQPPIEGNWSWNDEYTQLTFAPDHRFDTEREYELLFSGTVFTQGGYEVPVPDSALEFVSPPTILNTLPGANNAHPSKPIQIMFDRLMDQAATETAVSIIPPIDGSFTWNETTLIFKPARGYFDEFTTYEVTVSTNALGADGEVVLRHPYVWEFNTTKATSAANFGEGPRYQVVDVNGRRAIQYHAALTQSILVGFELHQIPNDQFATIYAANYTENYWEPTRVTGVEDPPFSTSWSMETNPADEEWMNIQETIIPADVPAGVYLLNITTGNVNDQLIV